MRKISGITARTTLLAWTVTLLTLIIFVVILIPQQKRDLRDGLESKARSVAAALQGEVAGAAVSEDYTSVVDHAQQVLAGDQEVDFLVITKNDGFSIIVERDSWREMPAIDTYWHPSLRRSRGDIEQVPLFNQRVYHYASPFDYSGLQWGWIHVGLSLKSYDSSVEHVYRRTGILSVICILLSLSASILYAKHFVGPILQLREVVEKLARGEFTARANIKSKDEIKQLADAFNDMADAIVQRNQIVESVRFTAQSLQSTDEWSQVIDLVLAKVGHASNACRVLVGSMPEEREGDGQAGIYFEWTAAYIAHGGKPRRNLNFAELGLEQQAKWGKTIVVRGSELNTRTTVWPDVPPLSMIIAPILLGDVLWGALVVQDCRHEREWGEAEQDSVRAVAEMLSASILRQKAQQALYEAKTELEHRVAERTRELREQIVAKDQTHAELVLAQKRLIEMSRLSGMAEVATGVLHNVGNVLNSINVSTTIIADRLHASRISQLRGVSDLLKNNQAHIGDFLAADPKGQRVLPYLDKLSGHLVQERDELSNELEGLVQHVGHVKEIVAMQQTYARTSGVLETLAVSELIEDALSMTQAEMDRDGVMIRREIEEVPSLSTDRHKVLQILLNLLWNAKDAVKASATLPREITVRVRCRGTGRMQFQVADNGVGIPPGNLARIFSHGFTTKKDGHGFGLHSGALTARQLGGSLSVESEGLSYGATFTLELPLHQPDHGEPDNRDERSIQ
jgi:signal transduction histidine kinase/HAMP domain-containing protein